MERDTKTYTYKIAAKSILGIMICATLFLISSAVVNAATSTVSTVIGSELFTPRYLPNILLGAKGPADMIFFLYKYLMGLVGIVAVGVIIYGGVLRTISASQQKVQQSNAMIKNAISGIILLFGAQVLFNTINPNIVDFPRIQEAIRPKEKFVPNVFTGVDIGFATSTEPTGSATAQGAVNLYGGTHPELAAKIKPCNDCASTNFAGGGNFQVKTGACFGAGCQTNKALISALNNLYTKTSASGIQWRMTEGYPPTVNHNSSCHFDGTCVDIGLTGGASAKQVDAFINEAKAAGLNVVNEYSVGANPQHFDTTTGGHLHVRL